MKFRTIVISIIVFSPKVWRWQPYNALDLIRSSTDSYWIHSIDCVHLCTLWAPCESSLNQLKCCWLCKCVRSVHLIWQKAESSISLQKSLWNSPETLHSFPGTLIPQSGAQLSWNTMTWVNKLILISQQVCLKVLHCSSTGNTDHTPVLCTSVLRFKYSLAF